VDTIYLVNAPGIFSSLFAMIKGFLDEVTQSKIKVFGTSKADKERFEASLKMYMDEALIPREYGGTSEVQVPMPLHAAQKGVKI
jgi:hypothetical protein